MSDNKTFTDAFQKTQEKKGYCFNCNSEHVTSVIEGLLINKNRYGYISCPCRLASGDREEDKPIICPCTYRDDDVRELGTCYCGLFVCLKDKNRDVSSIKVPDRHVYNDD